MFKFLIKTLVSLFVVFFVAAAAVFIFINPNDYKALIAAEAKSTVGISLEIGGDISWSFFPLGFKVSDLIINDRDGNQFSKLGHLDLSVDTLSLLSLSPIINGIHADNGNIILLTQEDGSNNWNRLISSENKSPAWRFLPVNSPAENLETSAPIQLKFLVENVELDNFSISYEALPTKQKFLITDLDISMQGIRLASEIQTVISYKLSYPSGQLETLHSLETSLNISETLDHLIASDMEHNFDIVGQITKNESLKLSLTGDLEVDLKNKILLGREIQTSGAGLALDASFKIKNFDERVTADGLVNLAPLNVKAFLSRFDLDISTLPKSLSTVALKAPFEYSQSALSLNSFEAQIDETSVLGQYTHRFQDQSNDLTLKVDTLDLNRYMESASTTSYSLPNIAAVVSNPASSVTDELLPIKTLSDLNLLLSIKQDYLKVQEFDLTDLSVQASIEDGFIDIESASTKILGGQIDTKSTIDLRLPAPKWKIDFSVDGVEAFKLVEEVAVGDRTLQGDGLVFAQGQVTALGNTLNSLKRSNSGTVSLRLEDGQLKGVNLNRLMCQGFASIRAADVNKDNWGEHTEVRALNGLFNLENGVISSDNLSLETLELSASGDGEFDINAEDFTYNLDIKAIQNASDQACEINPKFAELAIPVSCAGNLTPFGNKCSLNTGKILQQVALLSQNELNRKTKKEVDRAVDKAIEKYLNKDSELGQSIKKSLSDLFK